MSSRVARSWSSITGRQWVYVALLFLGIALAFMTYLALNAAPGPQHWPAYFAWNPATQALVQPLQAAGSQAAYQTFVLKSWLDESIPFVPALAVPYISFLILVPVVVPLLNLGVGSFRRFATLATALIVSQLVLDVAYYLFQTNVIRDVAAGDGIGGFLVESVWGKDQPFNGYPSGHCTWTTIAICALFRLRHVMPKTAWIMMAWLALIYPATVMLRQHYLMDVYAGIFVGFACYWACMFAIERPRLVPRFESDLLETVDASQVKEST